MRAQGHRKAAWMVALLLGASAGGQGCSDPDPPAGEIEGRARSRAAVEAEDAATAAASRALLGRLGSEGAATKANKQILFGDLHVHTTYSIDAFFSSLPLNGGDGAHPLADACDFARHCSSLDFFSVNDHAEGLTPERWTRTKQSIRECNEQSNDSDAPDLVAYVGWEWTQVGTTPETHYGHRNVILRSLEDDEIPARPITSLTADVTDRAAPAWLLGTAQGIGRVVPGPYAEFLWWLSHLAAVPNCERGIDPRELPPDCRENAATPLELFQKLDLWGVDSLVIPHGLAWGIHAPPGSRMDDQLRRAQHDPGRQRLLEIFSGHGSGEEYRNVPQFVVDDAGARVCPEPTEGYLPCCWRAGEIMRERCGELAPAECEARVKEAQQLALDAGVAPERVFPDTSAEQWLDCDQCRDCFKPAAVLRPQQTAQYGLAISDTRELDASGRPVRFRYGFIASSDNHSARAGSGYKQLHRRGMTDASGLQSATAEAWIQPWVIGEQQDVQRAQAVAPAERGLADLFDSERGASFFYTGGLVAAHAEGRSRDDIWQALERKEVYGTSGPRILLWFDLLNGPAGRTPMGSDVELAVTPRFQVRAAGSFTQLEGCPESTAERISQQRLERLCWGECYNPSDVRHPIDAIEVVRIRPQIAADEDVADLIEDPWLRLECSPDPEGCVVSFEDPDFQRIGRDTVYYVRVLQSETPAINGATLRSQVDSAGRVTSVEPCYGGYRSDAEDDCLAPVQERAWSSPIYVDWPIGASKAVAGGALPPS